MKLVVENLSVVRGEDQIFSALSFDIKAGQALIIRGANGVGKSSLLRALAGLLVPASGEIRLDDRDAEFADVPLGELCHYLGNDNAMKGAMSVQENLHFWQNFAGQPHLDIDDASTWSGLMACKPFPFPTCPPGSAAASALPASWSATALSGCWMNRSRVWTHNRKISFPN